MQTTTPEEKLDYLKKCYAEVRGGGEGSEVTNSTVKLTHLRSIK